MKASFSDYGIDIHGSSDAIAARILTNIPDMRFNEKGFWFSPDAKYFYRITKVPGIHDCVNIVLQDPEARVNFLSSSYFTSEGKCKSYTIDPNIGDVDIDQSTRLSMKFALTRM